MAYTRINYKTKKALREAIAEADSTGDRSKLAVFQPGPFGPNIRNGTAYLEGPHYPEPHRWYAKVEVAGGLIIKFNG